MEEQKGVSLASTPCSTHTNVGKKNQNNKCCGDAGNGACEYV